MPRARLLATVLSIAVVLGAPVPAAAAESSRPTPVPSVRLVTQDVTYTVRPNDSWMGLARRFGVKASTIAAANGKTRHSPIFVGQRLTIPSVRTPDRLPARLPADLRLSVAKQRYIPAFLSAAREFGVPYDLLMSQAYRESSWQHDAVSGSNAIGIGQLLPSTARWTAQVLLKEPGLDVWDPEDNIRMQARFLRYLLDWSGGDTYRALAAYYQGPGAVTRTGVNAVGAAYARSILDRRVWFRFG
jgi:soluble lytic murein transglycosylase-like protein